MKNGVQLTSPLQFDVILYESATLKMLKQPFAAHPHTGKTNLTRLNALAGQCAALVIVAFAGDKSKAALRHRWFRGPQSL